MTTQLSDSSNYPITLAKAIEELELALPAQTDVLEQDEEWAVVRIDGEWQKIRMHDYADVYAIPGLYEKWIYEVLQCQSPTKIGELLNEALGESDIDPAGLTVLDLGAGNGCVAEELRRHGIQEFVGVDLLPEAALAAERDRPGIYADYAVGDLLKLLPEEAEKLARRTFNCMTCIAALGFGDIPPAVFAAAFNRVENGGWVGFNIKTDFLDERDKSGFPTMIRRMVKEGALEVVKKETYVHRIAFDGDELQYVAFIGRKHGDIEQAWIPEID